MKKSYKIAFGAMILILASIIGYSLFLANDKYIARGEACKYIDYACIPGKEHFFDGIGCGCKEVTPL